MYITVNKKTVIFMSKTVNRVHWSLTTIIWVLFAHFPIEIFSNYYSSHISYRNYYYASVSELFMV